MARKIFDFNHISPELSREQVDELIGYYKTTHQKWFLGSYALHKDPKSEAILCVSQCVSQYV